MLGGCHCFFSRVRLTSKYDEDILVVLATFLQLHTSSRGNGIPIGHSITPSRQRYGSIPRASLQSTALASMLSFDTELLALIGSRKQASGRSNIRKPDGTELVDRCTVLINGGGILK